MCKSNTRVRLKSVGLQTKMISSKKNTNEIAHRRVEYDSNASPSNTTAFSEIGPLLDGFYGTSVAMEMNKSEKYAEF